MEKTGLTRGAQMEEEEMEFTRDSAIDDFMELVDSIDVVEVFHTAKDMRTQLSALYNLPFLSDYEPELGYEGKDSECAEEAIGRGKEMLESKLLEEAIETLNEAVKNARPWSRELGLALFERSTALFHMGEYELSRKDGVRAMRLCPSEEEKKTILKRQILCREALDELGYEKDIWKIRLKLQASRKALGEQWAEQEAAHKVMQAFLTAPRGETPAAKRKLQNDPRLPKLTGSRNANIPATSDALKLTYSKDQGRHYLASRKILPGEIVAVENPLASALYTDCWKTHCYHCHKRTIAGIPCFTCSLVIFCGEHCRDTAMKYHNIECNHMVELYDLGHDDGVLLAYRLIVQHSIDELLLWRPAIEAIFFKQASRSEKSTDNLLVCNDLGSTFDLLTHHDETNPYFTLKAAKTAVFLVKCLEQTTYFKEYSNNDDVKQFVGQLLYHYLLVVVCNYFTASEVLLVTGPPYRAETPPIATNLYCAGAYFNHSCAPNVTHYFANGRLVCRAHQVIEAGEPVTISYGSSFHSELLPQRKSYLWNSFHFRCRCPACVGKWAPLKQLLVANGAALKFKVFDEKYPLTRESVSTSEDEDTSVEEKTKRRATRSRLLTSRCDPSKLKEIQKMLDQQEAELKEQLIRDEFTRLQMPLPIRVTTAEILAKLRSGAKLPKSTASKDPSARKEGTELVDCERRCGGGPENIGGFALVENILDTVPMDTPIKAGARRLKNASWSPTISQPKVEEVDELQISDQESDCLLNHERPTMDAVSKMPMWPTADKDDGTDASSCTASSEEDDVDSDEDIHYMVSGGFQCPNCKHELLEANNIPSLVRKTCPGCSCSLEPYVERYLKAKEMSEEARLLVEGGHFGRVHDAIVSTGAYIQSLQTFVICPNLELLSTIVHLAHFFLLETIV